MKIAHTLWRSRCMYLQGTHFFTFQTRPIRTAKPSLEMRNIPELTPGLLLKYKLTGEIETQGKKCFLNERLYYVKGMLVWWYHIYSPTPESPGAARHQLLFEAQGTAERTMNKWSETGEWSKSVQSHVATKWYELPTNFFQWDVIVHRNPTPAGWKRRFFHRGHFANCVMNKTPPSFPDSLSITCFNRRNSNRSCLGLRSANSSTDPTTGGHDHWYRDKAPDSSRSLVPCNVQLLRSHSWAA